MYFSNYFDETWFEVTSIVIQNSSFSKIESNIDGGAVYIQNSKFSETNTNYSNNKAVRNGGAMRLVCDDEVFDVY